MPHTIIMPKTGMAMEEGTLVRWLKQVGEPVSKGEAIAVIETDKVTMDLESDYDGTLLAIVHRDGDIVPATHTIAWIGAPGEEIPVDAETAAGSPAAALAAGAAAPAPAGASAAAGAGQAPGAAFSGGKVPATPAARAAAAAAGIPLSSVAGSGPGGAVRLRDLAPARSAKATPLARKVAEMNGIDLGGVEGSGAGGKIRKADVVAHAPAAARLTSAAVRQPAAETSIPVSGMRRVIAEKMLRSHQQVPSVTLITRADVTELAALRAKMNAGGGQKVSYADFILRAAAAALREHPLINSVIEGDLIRLKQEIDIGMAVALEAGLIVPVIRGADTLSVRQIAAAARDLAERARSGSLEPDACAGGTFTITNLGMYGITEFTPLINVPESAILGVGAIEEAFRTGPAGAIESRKVMSLCLTHDHRHIDGAPAAAFLGTIRALLEDCWSLIC
jgi:pyruvate dehydrogenase E2 component (dihydrolipoamide acetyltransferase)